MTTQAWMPERLAARAGFLRRRALLTEGTRAFFSTRGYTEVETPYTVSTPGEEVFLTAFETTQIGPEGTATKMWLHTSPEFAMKKLLAGGVGPIFQIARVWRNREGSDTHAPEFSLLEWYRPGDDLESLMQETVTFLRSVLPPAVSCRGVTNSLSHFERLSVGEAFSRHLGIDVLASIGDAERLANDADTRLRPGETWDDLFFRLMLACIEPHLGRRHPTFLTDWPAPLAALARRNERDPRVAERFELYLCGMELANAFSELTDPAEQRARFERDRVRRHQLNGANDWPMDEDLLVAVGMMPACMGIALGFDRLAMIASGANRITDVLWL